MKLYNGWRLYAFEPFAGRLAALKREVERLRAKDPEGYRGHPTTALLASVYKAITEVVPANPDHPGLRVGHSLGPQYARWRRVKRGLPSRYRLFYRFSSKPVRVIVYAWLNDEATLRKAGAKTDVYVEFQRMLARGEVPSDIDALTKGGAEIGE
ncbi:MAG: type II toxin-antitoxin system YhaV family toxin [Burkholderiales bacterium]